MKTSEALLELAYKASKSGAMSADQALAMLRRVEWGVDEPETEQERADLDWFRDAARSEPAKREIDEPAEVTGYTPGSAPSVTEWGGNRIVTGRDEFAERDSYPLKPE